MHAYRLVDKKLIDTNFKVSLSLKIVFVISRYPCIHAELAIGGQGWIFRTEKFRTCSLTSGLFLFRSFCNGRVYKDSVTCYLVYKGNNSRFDLSRLHN